MFCMSYDYSKNFELFKFESDYRKFHLNSPKGYSRKIISVQTGRDTCYVRFTVSFLNNPLAAVAITLYIKDIELKGDILIIVPRKGLNVGPWGCSFIVYLNS